MRMTEPGEDVRRFLQPEETRDKERERQDSNLAMLARKMSSLVMGDHGQ